MNEQTALTKIERVEYNNDQIELIKRTFAQGATNDEFQLFMMTAQRLGLRPEARQIHMVKRKTYDAASESYVEKMSIQTGIDGYRLIADRTGEYAPGREPTYTYDSNGRLLTATAYVKKFVRGEWHEVASTAHYDEYVQTRRDGKPTQMWNKPHIMLSKCAEAQALRRAFPAELSGVYTDEEMAQADNVPVVVQKPTQPAPQVVDVTEQYAQQKPIITGSDDKIIATVVKMNGSVRQAPPTGEAPVGDIAKQRVALVQELNELNAQLASAGKIDLLKETKVGNDSFDILREKINKARTALQPA